MLNEYFAEWFYNAWDADDCGRLPWMMNIAAASYASAKTLARMQSRGVLKVPSLDGCATRPPFGDALPHSAHTKA